MHTTLAQAAAPATVASSNLILLAGLGVFAILLALFNYGTRAGTIARATWKECLRQPVFSILTAVGVLVVIANMIVPFFAMDDETKMFIDCGLSTILICCLLLAVWTASIAVAEEIEGKTAMTLLSKPINRRQFILGKYFGILQGVLTLLVVLGLVMYVSTYLKFGYDHKEQAKGALEYYVMAEGSSIPKPEPQRLAAANAIIPGLTLILMEAALMAAVSVAISTRLPMLPNMITCFAIFVIGHLTPVLVAAGRFKLVFVQFFANLVATLLPALDNLNMSPAISTGKTIPVQYVALNAVYTVAYVAAAILVAFLLFEDRDLA
ncbi:ABC-2 family transporter protein [Caulifigura coniformis]|uniref:ABC-2 family transporter protein n=1 Tax=Caulifigura coniformis TaxID=2527983 RepID=A0A517SCT6_9PLAN|nr:ABC transporter permease subunit [Caulifigura coniformis]QDT53937.1 ABC-2 family transporter protein [Caulifigura coniformis]